MPPPIALLLGFVLVVLLIRADRAFRSGVSGGQWVPLLWMLIISSRPVGAWIGVGGTSQESGSPFDALIALVLFVAAAAILVRRRFSWGSIPLLNFGLFAIFGFFALSVLWSPLPFVAFKRIFKELGSFLIVLVLITDPNPAESLKNLCLRCAYILFPLSVVLIKYFPHFGRAYSPAGFPMVTGVTDQKNSLGLICCVFCLALLWDLKDQRALLRAGVPRPRAWPQWTALALGIWLLIDSQSKTSLLALVAAVLIVFLPELPVLRRAATFWAKVLVLTVPLMLVLAAVHTVVFAPLLNAVGRDTTFTERTDIWQAVLAQPTNPLIGEGYFSFWLAHGRAVKDLGIPQHTSHNGYLETYLDGGAVACALLAVFLMTTNWRLAGSFTATNTGARFAFAFAIVALITNFSESYYFRLCIISFIYQFCAVAPSAVWMQPLALQDGPEPLPVAEGGARDVHGADAAAAWPRQFD